MRLRRRARPAGRSTGAIGPGVREQIQANPLDAAIIDQSLPALDALEAGRRVDTGTMHAALQSLFHPTVQGFLIVQGGRDLQVSTADAARLKQAAPESTLVLLPTANHVLKTVDTDDRAANAATYADPARPLAPGVVDAIADFIAPTRPAAPASAAAS